MLPNNRFFPISRSGGTGWPNATHGNNCRRVQDGKSSQDTAIAGSCEGSLSTSVTGLPSPRYVASILFEGLYSPSCNHFGSVGRSVTAKTHVNGDHALDLVFFGSVTSSGCSSTVKPGRASWSRARFLGGELPVATGVTSARAV